MCERQYVLVKASVEDASFSDLCGIIELETLLMKLQNILKKITPIVKPMQEEGMTSIEFRYDMNFIQLSYKEFKELGLSFNEGLFTLHDDPLYDYILQDDDTYLILTFGRGIPENIHMHWEGFIEETGKKMDTILINYDGLLNVIQEKIEWRPNLLFPEDHIAK